VRAQVSVWIVDGNNCIGRDPQLKKVAAARGMEAAVRLLWSQLGDFRRRQGRGHAVLLVLDGVAALGVAAAAEARGLRILRPRPGQDADTVVLDEARRHEGRGRVTVVTSDHKDIGARLRGLRVSWLTIEEFSRRLWPDAVDAVGASDSEKPKASRRAADVEEWLQRFGFSPNPDDSKP
jgi:predicted RNA-binding protein with PIN domain